ncbi:MAG: DoxX family protein [Flavisolibacter sp.]
MEKGNRKTYRDLGLLLLRLFVGIRLIYGVMDNVMSWEHMLLFRDFLALNDFPFPLTCAVVSVYAQLVCGILVIIGFLFRWASAIMVLNFLVAIFMVHRSQSFEEMTTPLLLVFIFLFFVLNGPGLLSLNRILRRTI